jgi:Ran GTPase-activating protein (RanGAP) involved in mRNA processing and transport
MALAAEDMGVGSCWVSAFDEQEMKTTLGIPDNARPQIILALGYPNEVTPRPPKERLETLVFLEQYGNRIRDPSMVLGYYSEITKRNVDKAKEKLQNTYTSAKENIESGIEKMQKDIDTQVLPRLKSYEDKVKEQQTPIKPKGEQPKDE